MNTKYASVWPNITEKRDAAADAKEFDGVAGKFEKYFSEAPAKATDTFRLTRANGIAFRRPAAGDC